MEYTQDLNFYVYLIQMLLHQELLSDVGSIQGIWARTFGGNLTNKKGPQWKLERGAFPSNLLKVEGYISSSPLPGFYVHVISFIFSFDVNTNLQLYFGTLKT